MTKQERHAKNIKDSIKFLTKHIDKFIDKKKRSNHLMGVGISCEKGTFSFYYGSDPVGEEVKELSKKVRKK